MSGDNSQGAGLASCAKAAVVSAVSAAATKTVLVENLVILHAPSSQSEKTDPAIAVDSLLNKSRTPSSRQYDAPDRCGARIQDFGICRARRCDYPEVQV